MGGNVKDETLKGKFGGYGNVLPHCQRDGPPGNGKGGAVGGDGVLAAAGEGAEWSSSKPRATG